MNNYNQVLQTLSKEQCEAVDWMIKNNIQSYIDGIRAGITGAEYSTPIGKMFRNNGIKISL